MRLSKCAAGCARPKVTKVTLTKSCDLGGVGSEDCEADGAMQVWDDEEEQNVVYRDTDTAVALSSFW